MVALEAQYIQDDNSSKSQQLIKNSALFIGSIPESEKLIKNMYNFRSRFLHGQKNFHNQFALKVDEEKFTDSLFTTSNIAVAMLLSTIQKLFKKEYIQENSP
jgi:hypothetical protein